MNFEYFHLFFYYTFENNLNKLNVENNLINYFMNYLIFKLKNYIFYLILKGQNKMFI